MLLSLKINSTETSSVPRNTWTRNTETSPPVAQQHQGRSREKMDRPHVSDISTPGPSRERNYISQGEGALKKIHTKEQSVKCGKRKRLMTKNCALKKPKMEVQTKRALRPIVIDGSNVARAHGRIENTYSVKGIKLAIEYFRKRGHTDIKVIVPEWRRQSVKNIPHGPPTVTTQMLEELHKEKFVYFSPSRVIGNVPTACYDDWLASSAGSLLRPQPKLDFDSSAPIVFR